MLGQAFSKAFVFILLLLYSTISGAQTTTSEEQKVQEKIYLHLDNTGYFPGDTIWYKAYVVRADDLHPTDMSRLLYVELLTPDGYVIERQHVIINSKGEAWGCFELSDTIYSGYYELRAYTLWQLNFNSYIRKHSKLRTTFQFYNKELRNDFYTDYTGLYSRVVPIYERNDNNFNILPAYKRRDAKPKRDIKVTFYPEGGNMVAGLRSHLAFEVTDGYGKPLDITGKTESGIVLKPEYEGRGIIDYTPGSKSEDAVFVYDDKTYKFDLPDVEQTGCVLEYNYKNDQISVKSKGVSIAAVEINCRGKNVVSQNIQPCNEYSLDLKKLHLPTGVNEFVVYDAQANVLAYRLLFVNNHDIGHALGVKLYNDSDNTEAGKNVKPYSKIDVKIKFPESFDGGASLSIRDKNRKLATYDDGNILSDLLLAGDLKGFVAHPLYYFESEDEEHKRRLNTLLIIQGWRKYTTPTTIKYKPERMLLFKGKVHKVLDDYDIVDDDKPDKVNIIEKPPFPLDNNIENDEDFLTRIENSMNVGNMDNVSRKQNYNQSSAEDVGVDESLKEEPNGDNNRSIYDLQNLDGRGKVKAKKIINVESEMINGTEVLGGIAQIDADGNFTIELPPYYGKRILFVTAYNKKDSLKYSLFSNKNTTFKNAKAYPEYYVQRVLPYPVFCKPYSWQQTHVPNIVEDDSTDVMANGPGDYGLDKVNVLPDVEIKKRRSRALRDFDWSHPVFTMDAYDIYNLATDRGTSFGMYEAKFFPAQAALALFGDMGKYNKVKIRANVDDICYYNDHNNHFYNKRKISRPELYKMLQLKRLQRVKVYTDYNMRDGSYNDVDNSEQPDVVFTFETVADENYRATYSVRRYILDGINIPYKFYSPDYSNAIPEKPNDYRRTLYWNPNVQPDKDGEFKSTFFTSSRQSNLEVSACGLSKNGNVYYYEP